MADSEIQTFHIPEFRFQDGSPPTAVKLAYLDINSAAPKAALVITCFRGRLQSTLNFSDGAFNDYRVIVVALFGNGESSSPSNMTVENAPSTFDYRDCVRAQHLLVTSKLGIKNIDVVLGFSMGGQCTYHWTLMYPDVVQNAVIICSSARTSKHNYQFLEGPRAALESSHDYTPKSKTQNERHSAPVHGLRAFGKAYSAWLTSAEWFEQEKYKKLGYATLADWDEQATSYCSWNPDDLLYKLRMWQNGDVTKIFKNEQTHETPSLQETLKKIKARVLLMPCQTDQYFTWEASKRESECIPEASFQVIPSIWGHIAGLGTNKEDKEWMDSSIDQFLNTV